MADLKGTAGLVTAEGKITSNGNASCRIQDQGGQIVYYVDYNNNMTNPALTVSLRNTDPTVSYTLDSFSSGFRLFVWKDDNGTPTPTTSAFDFIAAKIV